MGFKAQIIKTSSAGNFSETVEFKVLHCGNIDGNNNKFFCIELQKNPSTNEFQVFTHYGRLEKTSTMQVRGPSSEAAMKREYDKILSQKLKPRKDSEKGHDYQYREVETFNPTVGSDNIRSKTASIKKAFMPDFDKLKIDLESKRIIQQAYVENIHNITTHTNIRMTSNGLETPLGPVTKDHIISSRLVLDQIKNKKQKDKIFKDLNSQYFSMIPHPFGHKIPDDAWLDEEGKLLEEYDLLDQMEAAIQVTSSTQNKKKDDFKLGFDIGFIDSVKELKKLQDWFEKSRASNHGNLRNWHVSNAYKLNLPKVTERFNEKGAKMPPVKTLFHGSRNCNILSIMTNGLIIPPVTAGHVTGRMFGNGVYAASHSTKALNYSVGYWARTGNKFPNAFVFVVEFGMGKIKKAGNSLQGPIRGYDSIWARADLGSLYNDEYIVYDLAQVNITHILELEQR